MKKTLLIADDDKNILASLEFLLSEEGYRVVVASSQDEVIELIHTRPIDLLLTDLNFQRDTTSGREGIAIVKKVSEIEPSLPVVVMTGWATIDIAVNALKAGAKDFIQKPWQDEQLLASINNQIKLAMAEKNSESLRQQNKILTSHDHPKIREEIVAESSAMKTLLDQLDDFSQSDMNILLTGDNGTGKSMLAHYVHQASLRNQGPFVSVNMGAITETLFESEMFGHIKGAFTDAKEARTGRFEMAEAGTLFLDELANIPLSQQAKLLRVLEEKQFEKVGSSRTYSADVRIISATNANLADVISDNQFRQDLYYRLNTIELRVPSLSERVEDILPLANYFLGLYATKYQRKLPTLAADANQRLLDYTWPGNIRELSHLMERVLFTAKSTNILASDLFIQPSADIQGHLIQDPSHQLKQPHTEMTLEEVEKSTLVSRLALFEGNVTETAKSLGLSRSGYYRRVQKYGLE